ncbi:hypothetical protein [uncultured Maritimibacter sp.]|nr:hypothetical protein [uncultured Maritimibacter sp.]
MLDNTFQQPKPAKHLQTVLQPGHIVMFRFPVRLTDDPPKIRPCLVLDVVRRGGEQFAVLAYNTKVQTNANCGHEVAVSGETMLKVLKQRKSTRFVGARRITVSLDHHGFACNRDGTPILSALVDPSVEWMHAVRARIHAMADIRKERREARARRRKPKQLSLS